MKEGGEGGGKDIVARNLFLTGASIVLGTLNWPGASTERSRQESGKQKATISRETLEKKGRLRRKGRSKSGFVVIIIGRGLCNNGLGFCHGVAGEREQEGRGGYQRKQHSGNGTRKKDMSP